MKLVERELEILGLLDALTELDVDIVVVGGYAVSALARHRFSVDCDLVVRAKDVSKLAAVLRARGFSKVQEKTGLGKARSGRFIRFARTVDGLPVSVDLMVDHLVNRDTDGSWSFSHIHSSSVEGTIRGTERSVRARIPARELLMAMKLHSARMADVRDVVMLSEGADWKEVETHLSTGDQAKLAASLNRVLGVLDDPKLASSLKTEFSMKQNTQAEIVETRDHLRGIASKLKGLNVKGTIPSSMFGSNQRLRPFRPKEETESHGL